jgi:hypothetical protein
MAQCRANVNSLGILTSVANSAASTMISFLRRFGGPVARIIETVVSRRFTLYSGLNRVFSRLVRVDWVRVARARGPVREALRRSKKEGRVRIVPAGGTFVAFLTERDIADIYGLRAAVEPMRPAPQPARMRICTLSRGACS